MQAHWGGAFMLSEKRGRVYMLDGDKPEELMTDDERDAYYSKSFGMTYDEFWEYYKDDTPELLDMELDEFAKRCAVR
jgi:hypothetical protein